MEKDKVYFAKKFGVAERDIAPEFLPLLQAFDAVNEQNQSLTEKLKGSLVTHQHQYENTPPLTALLVRWGWGVWVFSIAVFLAFFFYILSENRKKMERLESVIQYSDSTNTYFIDQRFYKTVNSKEKKGIEFTL